MKEPDCSFCSQVEPEYQDIDSCLEAIIKDSAGRTVLYRGESCCYPTTEPGHLRIMKDSNLTFEEHTFLRDASMMFMEENFEDADPSLRGQGEMFLQHYGLPTDLLDFSSSLKVSAYFAWKDNPEHIGMLAILDYDKARKHVDIFRLADFRLPDGSELIRPQRQEAYAIRHHPGHFTNLKDEECGEAIGLNWYTFKKETRNPSYFETMENILDANDDPCANLMRQWLHSFKQITWHEQKTMEKLIAKIEAGL
jgi:hypothetical protein